MLVRVGIGLNKESPHGWLEAWLNEKGLMVFVIEPGNLIQTLLREPMDLLVCHEGFLAAKGEETVRKITAGSDSLSILLLIDPDRSDSGASFLAAGCEAVIPANVSDRVLKETIENLVQKKLEMQPVRPFSGIREPKVDDFASESEVARSFIRVARKVVGSSSSLLILGETGVGKERLALAIHREGPRSRGPFIPINCAALPENLLESELFGHEQGAFTGAVRARRGAFELAHKGTIFLDEVGDMPLHLQAKLLRVLQEKEFQKIGGEKRISVDVRVIAATNHDLKLAVEKGAFRRDLFYRLNVVNILIPPLRERPEDIAILVRKLIDQLPPRLATTRRSVARAAMEAMTNYSWPGNVRELMNVLERAILLGDGYKIELEDLPVEISIGGNVGGVLAAKEPEEKGLQEFSPVLSWKKARAAYVERFEKSYFEDLLRHCRGRVGEAAKIAGITPRALHQKLTRHQICKDNFK